MIGQRVPSIDVDCCLNRVHREAGCGRCAVACPVDAIRITGSTPELDQDACVGCGVCVAVCPTDVFGARDRAEHTLVGAAGGATDLTVVCVRRSVPITGTIATSAVVTHSRCLASLDLGHLVSLTDSGSRSVVLDDSLCGDCPIGSVRQYMVQAVEAASLLAGEGTVYLADESTGVVEDFEVIDGAHPRVGRRDLFRFARRELAFVGATRGPVPDSRSRLVEALGSGGSFETAGLPIADVVVDRGACSGCESCAKFCPTGALAWSADSESFELQFLPSLCLDCGICAFACPEDAISYGSFVDDLTRVRAVADGALVACASCGAATAAGLGHPKCTWCRHGAGEVAPQHDGAGLIDDIESQIEHRRGR